MGHPDHLPCTVVWRDLVEDPLSWIKPFLPWQVKLLATAEKYPLIQTPSVPKPEILQGGNTEKEMFFPPLYTLDPGTSIPPPDPLPTQLAPPLPILAALEGGPAHRTHSCIPDLVTTVSPLRVVGPQTRMGISHITTAPLPLVIFIIGEPKIHPSQKTLRNPLASLRQFFSPINPLGMIVSSFCKSSSQ